MKNKLFYFVMFGLLHVLIGCDNDATVQEILFDDHTGCTGCHQSMEDAVGDDVSIDTYWESTMMANAARDPYWLASVRREVLLDPDLAADIEEKCARCHLPMAQVTLTAHGRRTAVLDGGALDPEHDLFSIARDGVSCTLCHQVESANFGQEDSFTGGFEIDFFRPWGERRAYGPFDNTQELSDQMSSASGFVPFQSKHLGKSELCATCHTVYTPTVDMTGSVVGEFPEQTTFLEWQVSSYVGETQCQGCHMPRAQGGVPLSITGGEPRSPFLKHSFVGGNTYIPKLFARYPDALDVGADNASLSATIDRVVKQLQNKTASIDLSAEIEGGRLAVNVTVINHAGHKFPTGFPSRKSWLHLVVTDNDSQTMFESGVPLADGSIAGNDNDMDPLAFERHYDLIDSEDQVQIYEAITHDTSGVVTTSLMRADGYLKDNRLLPAGFSAPVDDPDIGVRGTASNDDDFIGGQDVVTYHVDVGGFAVPLKVQVQLLYQAVGYRWADNFTPHSASEIDRFISYYQKTPDIPVEIDVQNITVQ